MIVRFWTHTKKKYWITIHLVFLYDMFLSCFCSCCIREVSLFFFSLLVFQCIIITFVVFFLNFMQFLSRDFFYGFVFFLWFVLLVFKGHSVRKMLFLMSDCPSLFKNKKEILHWVKIFKNIFNNFNLEKKSIFLQI